MSSRCSPNSNASDFEGKPLVHHADNGDSSGGCFSEEQAIAQLRDEGCRPTPQRVAVFGYLASVDTHPTAEQIHLAVCQRLAGTSLATIYNSLDALIESGLAVKVVGSDGIAHFDARTQEHYHVRDIESGEIRDLPVEFDPNLLSKLDASLESQLEAQGLEVAGYRLEVLTRRRK